MDRYKHCFEKLQKEGRGGFIPFVVVGDPDIETSIKIIDTLVKAGADALELGIPFSDPVADGPVIQSAVVRALDRGAAPGGCFSAIKEIRSRYNDIPIGILTYINAVLSEGMDNYFKSVKNAGIDSVLAADMPVDESDAYREAAKKAGVDTVFIAPPNADENILKKIAEFTKGYTYVVTRSGVTGTDDNVMTDFSKTLRQLEKAGAPPAVVGFGISLPEHVTAVLKAGAKGAISGSATVKIIEQNLNNHEKMFDELYQFVKQMRAATR